MICWVIYDIKDDKARTKVHKHCKQAGLYPVQYSTFLGTLEPSGKDTLELQCEALINPDTDKVYMFPMSQDELKQTVMLGQAFDQDLITDQIRSLWL